MIHVSLILQPDVDPGHDLEASLVVPCCEASNSCLSSASIAVSILPGSGVRVVGGVVTLSKDPESVPTHRVGRVVMELIEWNLLRTVVTGPGWTIRNIGRSEPETEVSSSSTGVMTELVVRVDDPEAGRVDVRVQQGVGHPREYGKVVL